MPQGVEGGQEQKVGEKVGEKGEEKKAASATSVNPEVEKNLQVFQNIDNRYRSDPKFKEIFDTAWKGEYDKLTSAQKREIKQEIKKASDDDDPITNLQSKIEELKSKNDELEKNFTGLKNLYGWDKVSGNRQSINVQYEENFAKFAEENGFEYGSPAYRALFKNAIHEGRNLSRKYGLVDENGEADPLLKFSPELLKESFDNALKEFKDMGFDIAAVRRQEAAKQMESKRQKEANKFTPFLDKDKLKTPEGRAKQLEAMFNYRMRELGINRDQFKIV